MITTQGFQVSNMPRIDFASGTELAGRGPGENIAGFNSGIGTIDAIQNARNASILRPIQQDEARARLAQIQAETSLNQATLPYKMAQARVEGARALLPVKDFNDFNIVAVPQLDSDGKPSIDPVTNRPIVNYMKRQSGVEIDPTTMLKAPVSETTGVQTPGDTIALHAQMNYHRQRADDLQGQVAETRAKLAEVAQQNADTNAKYKQSQANYLDSKMNHYQYLEKQGKIMIQNTLDANGFEVHEIIDAHTGRPIDTINTGRAPVMKQEFLSGPGSASAVPVVVKPAPGPGALQRIGDAIGSYFSPSPPPPTQSLPVIPATAPSAGTATPAASMPSDDQLAADIAGSAQPTQPVGTRIGNYTVRVK